MSADKTDGQLYIEKLTKEFTDITATEADLGFGGKYSDFRNPITQVEMYNKAEAEAKRVFKGETSKDLKAKAEKLHKKTPGKFRKENTEIPEGYYDEETTSPETETEETSVPTTEPTVEQPVVEEPKTEEPVVETPPSTEETTEETTEEPKPDTTEDQGNELKPDSGETETTEPEPIPEEEPEIIPDLPEEPKEEDPVIPEDPEETP